MSFNAVAFKVGTISTTAAPLSSTVFGFATTDLEGAGKVTIYPTSASLYVNYAGGTPTTNNSAGNSIAVTSGLSFSVTGTLNVARLSMIAQTTSAAVLAILEK